MKTLLTYCVSPSVYHRFQAARHAQDSVPRLPVDVYVDTSFTDGARFNLSAARNRCIDKAVRGGYELLLLVDADTLIESLTVSPLLPDYGVAVVRDYGGNPEYQPCAWLALRRSVFTKRRYHEGFDSIFWQDIDFDQNVCGDIPKTALWYEMRCRHLPHPPATECPQVCERVAFSANLFKARQERLRSGVPL